LKVPVKCMKCGRIVGYEELAPWERGNVKWTICSQCLRE
jgi:hypothetical protein